MKSTCKPAFVLLVAGIIVGVATPAQSKTASQERCVKQACRALKRTCLDRFRSEFGVAKLACKRAENHTKCKKEEKQALKRNGKACREGFKICKVRCKSDQMPSIVNCGDSIAVEGEECDDGNVVTGDGCDSDCTVTPPITTTSTTVVATTSNAPLTSTTGMPPEIDFQVIQDITNVSTGIEHLGIAGRVVVSPDGQTVCALGGRIANSSTPADGVLMTFRRHEATGELTLAQTMRQGVAGVTDFLCIGASFSPDGANLYVVADAPSFLGGRKLHVMKHDAGTGWLMLTQTINVNPLAVTPVVSPDGKDLYIGGGATISRYVRDPVTGTVQPAEVIGITGFEAWVGSMAISSNGQNIYASLFKTGVRAFERDPRDGSLDVIQFVSHGPPGQVLGSLHELAISPDDANVYVGSFAGCCGLTAYRRDKSTGMLVYLENISPGTGAVDIGPRGDLLYNGQVVYLRDPLDGTFTKTGQMVNRIGGELLGVRDLAVNPSSNEVYLLSWARLVVLLPSH